MNSKNLKKLSEFLCRDEADKLRNGVSRDAPFLVLDQK